MSTHSFNPHHKAKATSDDERSALEGSLLKAMNLRTVESCAMKVLFLANGFTLTHASQLNPLTGFADTLHSHRRDLLNGPQTRASKELLEGMIRVIQVAIAKARGYPNLTKQQRACFPD